MQHCIIYGSVSTTNIIWISRWIINQATTCQARTVVESRLCVIIAACIVTTVITNATATNQFITGYYWRTTAARLGVDIVANHEHLNILMTSDTTFGYDNSTQICCSGKIWPIYGDDTQCCGIYPYDPSFQVCCPDGSLGIGDTCSPVGDVTYSSYFKYKFFFFSVFFFWSVISDSLIFNHRATQMCCDGGAVSYGDSLTWLTWVFYLTIIVY